MKDSLGRSFARLQKTFAGFTAGQKVVAVIGTAALLLGGFLVFRWAAAPSYAPLYSGLGSSDASSVVDQLNTQGVPYEITGGGDTIMVPTDQVYATRIALAGKGLPSGSDGGGYSLLDDQGLSTSQFQEQTAFKRAMEGELSKTIEALDGVQTAIVHLAIPQKEVFSDQQDPTTASVLVQTVPGSGLSPEQVQAVVNLVSSSVDGLATDKVTVTDQTGKVLSAPGAAGSFGSQSQMQQVQDFQHQKSSQVQAMLDRVLGPGNSTVQVTPDLNFDKTTTQTTRYFGGPKALAAEESRETLTGGSAPGDDGGVLGPDGQTEPTAGAPSGSPSSYINEQKRSDNDFNHTITNTEAAPGSVRALHVAVVVDTRALGGINPLDIQNAIAAGLGIDTERGDTIDVSTMPFDHTAEEAAQAELEAETAAAAKADRMTLIRNGGLLGLVAVVALVAWLQGRRRAKARQEATSYVVEQLRMEALERQAAQAALEAARPPAMLALEAAQADETGEIRDEIAALVERQPEDVAALLRGWLVEK